VAHLRPPRRSAPRDGTGTGIGAAGGIMPRRKIPTVPWRMPAFHVRGHHRMRPSRTRWVPSPPPGKNPARVAVRVVRVLLPRSRSRALTMYRRPPIPHRLPPIPRKLSPIAVRSPQSADAPLPNRMSNRLLCPPPLPTRPDRTPTAPLKSRKPNRLPRASAPPAVREKKPSVQRMCPRHPIRRIRPRRAGESRVGGRWSSVGLCPGRCAVRPALGLSKPDACATLAR
jgi:hypothetical protein